MFVLGDPVLHVLPADDRERRPESKRSLQRDGSQGGWGGAGDKRCHVPGHFDHPLGAQKKKTGEAVR